MAEILLSALLPVVFDKLASAALNKFAGSKEIHSELKKWNLSLRQIRTLLTDASQKEITDENVKDWLNRFQHLAYDIDDILDALAYDAMHRELTEEPAAGGISSKVKKLIPTCCTTATTFSSSSTKMHGKLNDITTRLQELYDEKNNLGLTVIADIRSKDKNRKYQGPLPSGAIVGREGEKEILVQQLLADHQPSDQNNFRVVPIVGMGGVGKTTLARLLYNEPKVQEHFELKAWVCVSDEFDSFNISKLIFESVAGEEKKFENPSGLQEALKGQLSGKKFLLVLDDVWSERIQDWDTLVPPFHAVAPGSKIIITTRKENLLQQLGYDNPYHLNKLSHNDALTLFAQHALGANNFDSYPTLRPHGEGIVQKCDGLPLALKSLGSLLRTKTNEEKWNGLLESEIWSLKDDGGILPALRLSYLDLSACLKRLFAYSCLFPKDYVFEKEDLILLWMAEGFLHESSTSNSMESLGEEYFDELLSRSFFQHMPNDKSLFMMHDLMNDLATSVAGEFFIRLDIDMKKDVGEQTLERYRHMSFVRENILTCKKFEAFERANSLRTFLAVPLVVDNRWKKFHLSNMILVDLLPKLPLLRTLCLSSLEIDEVPECVGNLKHLRYLNLSRTRITHLPENVCSLYNLQTLIVFGCHKLSKFPDSFLKLKNLRHFDIGDTYLLNSMPLGIGQLKSLQTLSKIVIGGVNEFAISGFKNLKNLRRRVSIHGLDKLQNSVQAREAKLFQMKPSGLVVEWSDAFDDSRKKMLEREVLDVLKPHSDNLQNLEIRSYGGTEFPYWVGDPSFLWLTVVKLYKCRNCMFLPPLGQLPSLKQLTISFMDEVKEVGSELLGNDPVAFPSLEVLSFEDMPQWEVWSMNGGEVDAVFPCLKELIIRKCPNLVKVSLEALPSLRYLDIWDCGDGVLTSLVSVASSVTELRIIDISGLTDDVWRDVVQSLGAIEKLQIQWCNEIRYLWESEAEACKVLVSLKKLYIEGCKNLVSLGEKEKEDNNWSNLLTSLRMLHIISCNNLEYLSCPNGIETLFINGGNNLKCISCPNSIEELTICWCSSISRVFIPAGAGGGCQKLKSLYFGQCNKVWEELEKVLINTKMPMLEAVEISGWQNLKSIMKFTCFIQLVKLEIDDCRRIESFPEFQNLTSLKHLGITNCESMDVPPRGGGVWPPKLHSLEIGKLKRPISEWGSQDFPTSFVDLDLYGRSAEEDDVTSGSQLYNALPSSLTELTLGGFTKLETISKGLQHLTSLQHLSIYDCPKLKDLPEILLPSLLSLEFTNGISEELKEKTSRRGSYWPLLAHIPCVDIC